MSHKLNKVEKEQCIDFLFQYGDEIASLYGLYDWADKAFVNFCTQNNIRKKGTIKTSGFDFFWFETYQDKNKVNDVAHHFMRHIRNAIAHGNIYKVSKNGRQYYDIKDYNKSGRQTMNGIIRANLFWQMLNYLIKSRKIQ